jgi:Raf kinase inhibitor-like YbhB/YbcL family protein
MHPSCQSHATLLSRNVFRQARCSLRLAFCLCGIILSLILLSPIASCGNPASGSSQGSDPAPSGFEIVSAAFKEGAFIPARFSCQGDNISPALQWRNPPAGTRSFALIVDDPDAPAGTWTHWVVFNLPAQIRVMDEDAPKQDELPDGGLQGLTSFGRVGYGGPCPPPGEAHRYFFTLYALDAMLNLQSGASRPTVLAAIKGHILAEAKLMGRFKR